MLNTNVMSVSIYLIIAVLVIFIGTKYSTTGARRVFVFATLFSLFFAMGLLVGHGIMPFPGLWILGSCWYTNSCTDMYGDTKILLLFTVAPMLLQWIIILAISFLVYFFYKRMGFDKPAPQNTSEKALKHRRIIAISWIIFGVIFFLTLIFSISNMYVTGGNLYVQRLFSIRVVIALLQITAGYTLLRNLSWAHWLCLPLSVVSLLLIPFGTILGAYYLYYYFMIERNTTTATT